MKEISLEIESEDLKYLHSRGFSGRTFEEAIKWFESEHGLTPIGKEVDSTDLKQLIQILKIRSL